MKTDAVAVRALCEFSARTGDLDLRFTPAPTALEGQAGHQWVAARRGPSYVAELPLQGEVQGLQVRGRADGFDPLRQRLEEIKTHKGRLDAMAPNQRALHWAQLKAYGALWCRQEGRARVELALVYVDVLTQEETTLVETHEAEALWAVLEDLAGRYRAWAAQEASHQQARAQALQALTFPHADFRAGQRTLAESVYRATLSSRPLLAEAPTGIGKTMGTVFPLLKAMPERLDKLAFLTAKTSGRALALQAVRRLQAHHEGLPVRALELVAREKACEHPDKACHGESCPLAKGFYDRLPAAREALVAQQPLWDRETVRTQAAAHAVCPYYLTQELVRWADLVVGDHHHGFDGHALMHAMAQAHEWRLGVLVDEAHNLVDRVRQMYSAALSQASLQAARQVAPSALVRKALDRLHRSWLALNRAHTAPYQVLDALPAAWMQSLQLAVQAIASHQIDHPAQVEPALQAFYLEALRWTRLAESFDTHSLCDLSVMAGRTRPRVQSTLTLRNVWPAPFLRERLAQWPALVLFSGTVRPFDHVLRMLGLPERTVCIEVPSPFKAEQLKVEVAHRLSTRWRDRAASLQPMAELMARTWRQRPGNYLAFFSSHDYLQAAAERFQALCPDVPVWCQQRGMSEAEQAAFLARFTPQGQGIGFAVLGGSFGEGVDLPGTRLIGAFIATLGLPQVNEVNEQMRLRLDSLLGAGYDAVYLVPGLQKVVQAAGRVIRTPQDTGVVVLMDDRYGRREVQALLPGWWSLGTSADRFQ